MNYINQLYILNVMDTALRVPPLFVMDAVLKCSIHANSYEEHIRHDESSFYNEAGDYSLGGSFDEYDDGAATNFGENSLKNESEEMVKMLFIPTTGKIMCFIIALFVALVVFLLSWPRLLQVYSLLVSLSIIVFSYQANVSTVKLFLASMESPPSPALLQSLLALNSSALWESSGMSFTLASNYLFQAVLGLLFASLVPIVDHSVLRGIVTLSFLVPTFSLLLPLPSSVITSVPVFGALFPLGILKFVIVSNLNTYLNVIYEGYQYARMILRNYGLHSLIESEWGRLSVPNVLRTFWLIRTAHHLSVLLGEYMQVHNEYNWLSSMEWAEAYQMFKAIMTNGCSTCIALLGMTSIVSYISHYVGVLFQIILMSEDDEERNMGTVCAILFFILAEQSGLTVLEDEKRFVRLCRNFSFLFTAVLHFIHNMANPVLMSLSASRNPARRRHCKALLVCLMLLTFPCLLLSLLWNNYPMSTWLLAVSAFSIQVIVKTLVSLLIYSLFLMDAYRKTFWEKLDDYVYYIRAFGNSVEFVFGILLFFTGAWIYFFESGGTIRAIMMCIHAYFNIWCEAKNGWSVFMKRRTAVNKINSIPEATEEQLSNHADVCAICYQELSSAKITKCNHYFHSVCLRKWLYVQDSCPLCHETLYRTEQCSDKSTESTTPVESNQGTEEKEASGGEEDLDHSTAATQSDDSFEWDHDVELVQREDENLNNSNFRGNGVERTN